MARSNIGRALQIGKEVTSGIAVPANKSFASLNLDLNFEGTLKTYRSQGFKFNTTSSLQRSWQKGTYDGPMTFTEIIYPLSSLFGTVTPTTPTGGTLSRTWTYTPAARGQDVLQTFTIEEGDATAATQVPGVVFTSLALDFAADDLTIKGGLIGQTGTVTTLTPNPTVLSQVVAAANQVDVFIAPAYTTQAALFDNANKITDAYTEMFDIGEKVDPHFVHNTAFNSYKELVEKPAELKFSFSTEFNAQARALYSAALLNTFRYIGVRVLGPVIEGTIRNSIYLTVACSVTPGKREDAGGVWGYTFECSPIYDQTLGSAFQIAVTNTVTAL